MSRTTTVVVGGRGFWAVDDAFAVWLAYLVEALYVEATRIAEVAEGFVALITGTMPADPDAGAWFLGTGEGWQVMDYQHRPLAPDAPRF